MHLLASGDERTNFLNDRDLIYYKLVGGLGNQLFGLSRAYLLHKELGKRIAIDVSNLDHTPKTGPEWANWEGLKTWSEIINSPTQVATPGNLWNLADSKNKMPKNTKHFTGWRLSLLEIESSGLFAPNEVPFSMVVNEEHTSGIHIRGGDYRNSQGIGLLSRKYYKKAIEIFSTDNLETFCIFTDDFEFAESMTKNLMRETNFVYSKSNSPLKTLLEMSICKKFIGSNSTLSWWAAYFSKSDQIILPKPMYLQDWSADREITLQKAIYLDRFSNIAARLSNYLLWKYIRR